MSHQIDLALVNREGVHLAGLSLQRPGSVAQTRRLHGSAKGPCLTATGTFGFVWQLRDVTVLSLVATARAARSDSDQSLAERAPDPPARACPWRDQAEIYFSIVQRNVISPNDFTSLD
jgi:hypothetical protein